MALHNKSHVRILHDRLALHSMAKIDSLFHNINFLHFFFIIILCSIHFGFHFLDFKLLLDKPQNFVDAMLILTSFDAYHYAKGTREFLSILNTPNFSVIYNSLSTFPLLSILAGILAKYTSLNFSLSFSSLLFSATFAPIMYALNYSTLKLLAQKRYFSNLLLAFVAFIATLIALLLPSFYQRVGAGYFDTDMLLLTLPLCALFFLLKFINTEHFSSLVLFAIFAFLAINWHNGIQNLFLLGFLLFLFVEILLMIRFHTIPLQNIFLSTIFFVVLTPSPLCLAFLIALLFAFRFYPKGIWLYFGITLIYSATFGLFNPFISQINAYIFGSTQHTETFIFTSVVNTILETSPTKLSVLISRSGGIFIFSLGILGFMILLYNVSFAFFRAIVMRKCIKIPLLYLSLFLLPFCLLGIGAIQLGVRFSFFLVPIVSLGVALFLLFFFAKFYRYLSFCIVTSSIMLSLSLMSLNYSIPKPILSAQEIIAFKTLDSKLSPNDFIFSWWDYGYALRYFTKAQILLDGGRHSGAINYPIAKILLSDSPILFYNFSLLLAQNLQNTPQKLWNNLFSLVLEHSNTHNIQDFLESLSQNYQNISLQNNAQVYWVLPLRVLPLLANINTFANLNPENGKPINTHSIFAFNTENLQKTKIHQKINIYQDFYTQEILQYSKTPLTQINLGKNSFLLSIDYLKSNIIQAMLFNHYPLCTQASGEIVRIYHLKDKKCAESQAH
ncbi:peptide transporter [Helicobacter sp. MIT 11-5569]|uniref:STT3 domain-containing protein n=1 Tax=Helicobacter sp. MIT 11-5569 TaxID=1548151 RepID=UPI00051FAD6B|nr:STT3 domain-containing protein [Helicobacter sp. MIT 11-5569]TLD82885.1 peptide transporter [Helicobacter sp. MIT 11-5569]